MSSDQLPMLAGAQHASGRGIYIDVGRTEEIRRLSTDETFEMCRRTPAQLAGKKIDAAKVRLAAASDPFGDYAGFIQTAESLDRQKVTEAVENFLRGTFSSFRGSGVSFSLTEPLDARTEKEAVEEIAEGFKEMELDGQAQSIREEYARLKGARNCFRLMHQNNMLRPDCVLPVEYLPEVLMAAPVWYIGSTNKLKDLGDKNDPEPDHACRYFCSLLPNQVGADLYQLYNRQTRTLNRFSGRDVIPVALMQLMKEAQTSFDYTVIATPYHDIASGEWADENWKRNIDPFLLGFVIGLPFIFMLGRWSGSGVFPMFLDMVADTAEHLRSHSHKINTTFNRPYWVVKGEALTKDAPSSLWREGDHIEESAQAIVNAFDTGNLFRMLRTPIVA